MGLWLSKCQVSEPCQIILSLSVCVYIRDLTLQCWASNQYDLFAELLSLVGSINRKENTVENAENRKQRKTAQLKMSTNEFEFLKIEVPFFFVFFSLIFFLCLDFSASFLC
jgi:hypothetical protein